MVEQWLSSKLKKHCMLKHETEQEYTVYLAHTVIILHWQRKKGLIPTFLHSEGYCSQI